MTKTKEEIKKSRIIELIRYKAENPKIKRKQFLEYIQEQFDVYERTAIRYWDYIIYRDQQMEVMLTLSDQLYVKAFDKEKFEICSDLLRLKFDIITKLH